MLTTSSFVLTTSVLYSLNTHLKGANVEIHHLVLMFKIFKPLDLILCQLSAFKGSFEGLNVMHVHGCKQTFNFLNLNQGK